MTIPFTHENCLESAFENLVHACTNARTHAHTHTTVLQLSGFCPGQPGWAATRRNIHPLTPIMVISQPLSASTIYSEPWHPPCSIYVPESVFPQSLTQFSSWPGTLHFILHKLLHPIIVFFFAPYAHTIATCFAVRLCHPILVSLLTLYLELLSCSLTPHIHLTILIFAHWSATSFSLLTGHAHQPIFVSLL